MIKVTKVLKNIFKAKSAPMADPAAQMSGVSSSSDAVAEQATIIPRSKHAISRNHISDNALKVLYRLKNRGFAAYLVGGWRERFIVGA